MNVLVTLNLTPEQKGELEKIMPGAVYVYGSGKDLTGEMVNEAEIILGSVPTRLLEGARRLKWIQLETAGSDHVQKILPKGVIVTNASGSYGGTMAEYMLGMLLFLQKNLHICRANQMEGLWRSVPPGPRIEGAVVLVLGLGDIGGAFAKRMKALGAYIIGLRRTNNEAPVYVDELHLSDGTGAGLDELLPRADIIAMALPSTAETRHILSRERIGILKESAFVINVGRGSAIDTEALCDALYSGKIRGAGLDVTDPEPLPQGHRLWQAPNCLITPHVSGMGSENTTYEKILALAFHNFRAFVSGGELKNVVDFARGY